MGVLRDSRKSAGHRYVPYIAQLSCSKCVIIVINDMLYNTIRTVTRQLVLNKCKEVHFYLSPIQNNVIALVPINLTVLTEVVLVLCVE